MLTNVYRKCKLIPKIYLKPEHKNKISIDHQIRKCLF